MTSPLSSSAMLALQPRAARTIHGALANRAAHAFMLSGPADAGADQIAIYIAQRVLCPNGGGDDCDVCGRVARRSHPDLLWVAPEGRVLRIDAMRELVETLSLRPFEANAQVVVLEAADTLSATNAAAGNTLLKSIEEPTGDVVFILLAERTDLVLPTIRSRVIELPMAPVAPARMVEWLHDLGLTDASVAPSGMTLEAIARVSMGRAGRALDLARCGPTLDHHHVAMNTAAALTTRSMQSAEAAVGILELIGTIENAAREVASAELTEHADRMPPKERATFLKTKDSEGFDARVKRRGALARDAALRTLLTEISLWYRDLMAVHADPAATIICADRDAEIRSLAQSPAAVRAVSAIDSIEETMTRLPLNVDTTVAFDSLCAELYALAENRTRARRTIGAPSRTPMGVDIALG